MLATVPRSMPSGPSASRRTDVFLSTTLAAVAMETDSIPNRAVHSLVLVLTVSVGFN